MSLSGVSGSNSTISGSSGTASAMANSLAMKTNKNISSLKKYEAQASLFFFLEAARGFYTKVFINSKFE